MSIVAEVRLWNRTIGAVSLEDGDPTASFEYSTQFSRSGIQPSPLVMPLSRRVWRFPSLPHETFHGLPGLLADSLPDRFGNALIDAWLARNGRSAESFNAVERLCYTGSRGMGALEFVPSTGPAGKSHAVDIAALTKLAAEVLAKRENLSSTLDTQSDTAMKQILQVGTSAGGARAKAVIAWNPQTNEVRSGQVGAPDGFEYWLLKFDGVSNRDRELSDPEHFGAIEYAYHLMASAAGISMSRCRLHEENGRRHFMTARFDRDAAGHKLHMQSLCALAHFDFNTAGVYGYEQAFEVLRTLSLPFDAADQLFRRMAFNIGARNQDDHVKNIAFLMDKSGRWSLAPAFDVTYSYNPGGLWTGTHQMTMNGKRDGFTMEDFSAAASSAGIKKSIMKEILHDVSSSVGRWREFADEAKVNGKQTEQIERTFRKGFAG